MATFLNDTFTDTASTALASHTGETGATWTEHTSYGTGDAVISNANRCRCTTTNLTSYHASGSPAAADYDVEAVLRRITNLGHMGVAGRIDTSANTMYVFQYNSGSTEWRILEIVAGSATVADVASATLVDGNDYSIKLEMRGTAIKGYVGGVETCSITSSGITTAGKAGFRGSAGSDATGYHLASISATDAVTARARRMMLGI